MRIVGVDVGTKVTGIAFSDEGKMIAISKDNISGYKDIRELKDKIIEKMSQYAIEKIVLGNPIHMNGRPSQMFEEIKSLGSLLGNATNLPVVYWDERLSTQAIERSMLEGDLTRKKRKRSINAGAAQWILQGYLDYLQEV
ncbi:MAG: Holliday junction resolvase RuvX [Candidatus Aureabacteria bacterium]|nr:Holliday junction resolvase RuvX [Candidatus Auribacterota bacterium]